MPRLAATIFGVGLCSCAASRPTPIAQVDHVILGVAELDAGIRELDTRGGVHAALGGDHPDGTHNALASLGPATYLEILAPRADAGVASADDLHGLAHLSPIGFAIFVPDVDAARARLARAGFRTSEPTAGARTTPDGQTLRWVTFSIEEPPLGDIAPFFIHWDVPAALHPAQTSPSGCTLVAIDLVTPHARALAALGLPAWVHLGSGTEALAVTLRCGTRTIRFP